MTTNLTPKLMGLVGDAGFSWNQTPFLTFRKGYSSISANTIRKSLIAEAKKKKKEDSVDAHSFVPKRDEATGIFPEAVLLKEVTSASSFSLFFFFFFNFVPPRFTDVVCSLRKCFSFLLSIRIVYARPIFFFFWSLGICHCFS